MASLDSHGHSDFTAAQWGAAFDAISDAVCLLDIEGRIERCNKAMASLLGKSPSDIIGRHCWELVHGTSQPIEGCPIVRMRQTRRRETMDLPLGDRWFEVSVDPLFDDAGELIGAVHIIADTTERKRAEEKLRGSEETKHAVLNSSPDVIAVIDKNGIISDVNEAMAQRFGKHPEELIGRNGWNLIPPELAKSRRQYIDRVFQTGQTCRFEDENRGMSFDNLVYPISKEQGQVTRVALHARDITEHKQAEETIRCQAELLQKTLGSIPDAIFILSATAPPVPPIIVDCNAAASTIFGYEKAEMLGKTTEFLHVSDETLNEFQSMLYLAIEKGALPFHLPEFRMKRKDGSVFPSEHFVTPLLNDEGERISWVSIVKDLTERKQAEEALRESERKYRELFDKANIGIVGTDGTKVVFCNDKESELFGYRNPSDLIGRPITEFVHQDDLPIVCQISQEIRQGKAMDKPVTFRGIRREGSEIIIETIAFPFPFEGRDTLIGFHSDITERKRAEEELRKFKAVSDKAGYGVAMSDLEGNLIYVNESFAWMHGYTPGELIGKHLSIFHREEQMGNVNRLAEQLRQEGNYVAAEVWHKRKDNTDFPTLMNGTLIRDEKGTPLFMAATAIDITGRKQAEGALQESEERYRLLFEQSPVGIGLSSLDGKVLDANKAMEAITGYSIEELKNIDLADTYQNPEDRKSLVEALNRYGSVADYAVRLKRKDGTPYDAMLNISRVHLSGEDISQTICIDITERKRAEEALRASEKNYRELADSITDVFFAMDKNLRYVYWNKASEELTGVPAEDALGKYLYDIFPDDEATRRVEKTYLEVLKTKQPQTLVNEYLLRGKDYIFEISAYPSANGISVFVKDVTERKRMEQALQESEQKYRELAGNIPGVVFQFLLKRDGSYSFPFISRAISSVLGVIQEEAQADPSKLLATVHRDDLATLRQFIAESARTLATWPIEFRVHRTDGELRWARAVASPHLLPDGSILWNGVGVDITEHKRAEEALRQERDRAQKYLNIAGVILVVIDADGRVSLINKKGGSILGYREDELIGRNWFDSFLPERMRDEVRAVFNKLMAGESVEYHENPVLTKSGEERLIAWHNTVLTDEKGKITGTLSSGEDITERKRAEEELKRSRARLRKAIPGIIRALASVVEVKDPYTAGHQGRVSKLACAIAREMGLSEEQTNGIYIAGTLHDIGKIYVPAEILSRPGPLKKVEMDMIKTHPEAGYEVLKNIEFPWPVAQAVLQHHEALDGSGYPNSLHGEEIILEARILRVADVVEAMSSHRPYRPAHSIGETLEEISKNRGILYDAAAVDACLRLFGEKGFKFK